MRKSDTKMADGGHFEENVCARYNFDQNEPINLIFSVAIDLPGMMVRICQQKLRFDLKWREMWSKIIFVHPKYPQAYCPDMSRNAIGSDFRTANMTTGGHYMWMLLIDMKWREMRLKVIFGQNGRQRPVCEQNLTVLLWSELREMRSNVIFGYAKWPPEAILWKRNFNFFLTWWT